MASREDILAALRRSAPAETERPDLSKLGVAFPDPLAQLEKAVVGVGGACVRVPDLAAADAAVAALPHAAGAAKVVSLVEGVGRSTLDLTAVPEPHALNDLDVAILPGELAVAENGAVWVEAHRFHHRVLFVIANHLVLVVSAKNVVSDMHQA